MRMPNSPVIAIVLAGQRAGVVNPLAERAGVSHKCLAPIRGKALLAHVLETLTQVPAVSEVRVSIEADAHPLLAPLIGEYAARGLPVRLVASSRKLVDSVLAAAENDAGPFLITTADNVLVTPAAIAQVREAMESADVVFALARKASVMAAHPEGQRNYYQFRDDDYANCNLYGLANRRALASAEVFRGGGQFMKSVWRMIKAFGFWNIVLLRLGAYGREGVERRLSKRIGLKASAAVFEDGSLAIDVDNERTYRVCDELLAKREAA